MLATFEIVKTVKRQIFVASLTRSVKFGLS